MHKPGIEPGSIAWQATILPLDHLCNQYFKRFILLIIMKKYLFEYKIENQIY